MPLIINDEDDDVFYDFVEGEPLLPSEAAGIHEKLQRIVFIQQTDCKYHSALADIREQTIISVVVEPSFYGRFQPTSVLVIATTNNVYIFDILALGSIMPELRFVLESPMPLKILHYSNRICDHLYFRHNINLNSFIDTFVVLCTARQTKLPYTLCEAIAEEFHLDMKTVQCDEVNGCITSKKLFFARPLSFGQVEYLGKMAIYQEKLYQRLITDNMRPAMEEMSLTYSQQFQNCCSGEVALRMGRRIAWDTSLQDIDLDQIKQWCQFQL